MNKAQWEYIKVRLIVLGCIAGLALMILGIAYEWGVVYLALLLACAALLGYAIALVIATIIYRWRVMAVTNEDEIDLLDRYWHWTIKDGYTNCKLREIEFGEVGEDWDEDYRQYVSEYLLKVALVKRPKIIDI